MKKTILALVVLIEIIAIWLQGKVTQNLDYHNFADQREIFGIQKFFDVFSNVPFLIIGILGMYEIKKNYKKIPSAMSWFIFFIGVFLVAPGSMYYHLNPSNATLVWDRLPMTIGFMALTVSLVSLYYPNKWEKVILPIALAIGFGSIAYWIQFDDLRIYIMVQITPILIIPTLTIMHKHAQVKKRYLFGAFFFYLIAKLTETYDVLIYENLGFSGHSIKHLLAAIAITCFIKLNSGLRN